MQYRPAAVLLLSLSLSAAEDGWQPQLSLTGGLGYDSNVPVRPSDDPVFSDTDSAFAQMDAEAGALWRRDRHRLRLLAEGGAILHESDLDRYDQYQLGGRIGWQHLGLWIPSLTLHARRYWLDDEQALDSSGALLGLARSLHARHVVLGSLQLRHIEDELVSGRSGERYGLNLGYWYLFGDAGRRVQVELLLERHEADTDAQAYDAIEPRLGGRWRWNAGLAAQRTDLELDLSWRQELADNDTAREDQRTLQISGAVAWYATEHWQLRLDLDAWQRDSDNADRDYDRFRSAIGLQWTY